jgi:hypothetical protein
MRRICFGAALLGLLAFGGRAEAGINYGQGLGSGQSYGGGGADPFYSYTFVSTDGLTFASGLLDATSNGGMPETFTANSGTGFVSGATFSGSMGLVANPNTTGASYSASGFFIYDDQLLPGQNPSITNPGLLFNLGGVEVNIFSNGPGPGTYQFYEYNASTGVQFSTYGTFTLSAVPEPASLLMSGMAGLVGLGIVGARRRKVSASA